ncbi:alkaline phosphatase PhoX [Pontibacter sp. G13]|uniref:alkaline phosphatase PhoX n=1 Tax=Pontibacter sp. G13 TaxID=3074898 RepID=UPI0028897DEC|nr:alkaline phosphatase PhoX [Pontibacter sp. G13]WNJ18478.1 DUF839 domain-containing protein [Pontibacter sp. G13]
MDNSRRDFLKRASVASLGFMGLGTFACTPNRPAGAVAEGVGFGNLVPDPAGLFDLPEGFTYQVISRWGQEMADGLRLPNRADGMASFPGTDGRVILVRNHEVSTDDLTSGAFGDEAELLGKTQSEEFYDFGAGEHPGLGGTSTLIYNEETGEVERQFMSLLGTVRNCAGGPTPWGSWITCEETVVKAGEDGHTQDHGYNFEVPATENIQRANPIPLKEMGRFNHEAVCVDPKTGIVYQTEDRGDGLIYRFIPNVPGELAKGGKLQALVVRDTPSMDTRNWPEHGQPLVPVGQWFETEWVDLDDVESPKDDLRHRGFQAGAARFARGEGMWFGKGEMYFACTNGGEIAKGQVFRYVPSEFEGTDQEAQAPGRLQLFVEPNDTDICKNCDNLTVAASGDVFMCEDSEDPNIIGVTPNGELFIFGTNVGHPDSELTGVNFSPSGKTMFVNIQHKGLTLAITGPWDAMKRNA